MSSRSHLFDASGLIGPDELRRWWEGPLPGRQELSGKWMTPAAWWLLFTTDDAARAEVGPDLVGPDESLPGDCVTLSKRQHDVLLFSAPTDLALERFATHRWQIERLLPRPLDPAPLDRMRRTIQQWQVDRIGLDLTEFERSPGSRLQEFRDQIDRLLKAIAAEQLTAEHFRGTTSAIPGPKTEDAIGQLTGLRSEE